MDEGWRRGGEPGRRLDGRVVVVTGAGSAPGLTSIGQAIAVLSALQGAAVGVLDISPERAAATQAIIEEAGGSCVAAIGDLTRADDNARCISEVVARFGKLDAVVNSAAIVGAGGSPVDVDMAEWHKVMEINLTAVVLTAKHAIPHLRAAGGGAIVNISSIAAMRGMGGGAYTASKAAMIGLTREWAYSHGTEGIRVNCIAPGHVYTPMGDQGGDDLRQRRRRAGVLATEGTAWDIAWPAVFLLSDEARWITGVTIPVDAGTTSTGPLAMDLLNGREPNR